MLFATAPSKEIDVVHLFTAREAELQVYLQDLRRNLRPDATLWISWPKKAAKVPTDITEDTIRKVALPLGWVDVKVCAVSEVWSGLKLVVRKELRSPSCGSEGAARPAGLGPPRQGGRQERLRSGSESSG